MFIGAGSRQQKRASSSRNSGTSFPAGTVLAGFVQTSAPTGWTKVVTHNDKALRVVSGTASSGGSVAFTTAFASQTPSGTVGNTALTAAQIPANTAQVNMSDGGVVTVAATSHTGSGSNHTHSFTGNAINLAVSYVDIIIATKD